LTAPPRLAGTIVFGILGAIGVVALLTWFRREYNHDDFFFAYSAWLRAVHAVPFRDYYLNGFTVQAEIAAPLFRFFPQSFIPLHIARLAILVCVTLLALVTYHLSRALGAPPLWAATATAVMICQPDVVMRMGDIRTDPVAALFLLASALALLRVRPERAAAIAGLLWGCAIGTGFKVVLSLPFIVVALIVRFRRQWLAAVATFALTSTLEPLLYYSWRLWSEGWSVFLRLWKNVFAAVAAVPTNIPSVLTSFAASSPITPLAILLGLAGYGYAAVKGDREGRAGSLYGALAFGFVAATLAVNPFLFPYNFLILTPLLAPLVGGVRLLIPPRMTIAAAAVAAGISILAVFYAAPSWITVAERSNQVQIALVEWIWRATAPNEHVFDWQGLHFGRPGIYHWWTYSGLQPAYRAGAFAVQDELRQSRVSLIIDNFRIRYLTPGDARFIDLHYVRPAPCVLVPGAYFPAGTLASPQQFEVIVPGTYRVAPAGTVSIDGHPGSSLRLDAGWHSVSGGPGGTAIYFTTARRELAGPPPCSGDAFLHGFD
jgi:hypothetical protein